MDIDKELLKILNIKPSLQESPKGGYFLTDYKKEQLEAIKALFALREVVKSLPTYNDALNKLGERLFEEDIEYVKFIKSEKETGFFTGFLECYKWLTN